MSEIKPVDLNKTYVCTKTQFPSKSNSLNLLHIKQGLHLTETHQKQLSPKTFTPDVTTKFDQNPFVSEMKNKEQIDTAFPLCINYMRVLCNFASTSHVL